MKEARHISANLNHNFLCNFMFERIFLMELPEKKAGEYKEYFYIRCAVCTEFQFNKVVNEYSRSRLFENITLIFNTL